MKLVVTVTYAQCQWFCKVLLLQNFYLVTLETESLTIKTFRAHYIVLDYLSQT